jgi:hypothetical protein
MLRKSIIAVALFSLLMTVAAWAQPAKKRAPRQKAIWGMETDFGANVVKPRRKRSGTARSVIQGGTGGAILGVRKPRTR